MDRAHGRIGFMSTQRRVYRRRHCARRKEALEQLSSASETRIDRADASGGTALLMSIFWLTWASLPTSDFELSPTEWMATNSLRSDYRNGIHARLKSLCRSLPPHGANRHSATANTARHRLLIPEIPILPACTRLHRTSPQAPAGQSRWAERYDGKGNLHFKHAA